MWKFHSKVWISLITLDQKFILHVRKILLLLLLLFWFLLGFGGCLGFWGLFWFGFCYKLYCVIWGRWSQLSKNCFINKSKAYAVKTEIILPFYVQIKASVKPSAVVHLICGNVRVSGLILKYSSWGRKYFKQVITFEIVKKSDMKEIEWCFKRICFPLLSPKFSAVLKSVLKLYTCLNILLNQRLWEWVKLHVWPKHRSYILDIFP